MISLSKQRMAKLDVIAFLCFISSLLMGSDSMPTINIDLTIDLVSGTCETSIENMLINTSLESLEQKYYSNETDATNDAQTKLFPCKSNPCLYGASCETTEDQKDYICKNCPYPMGGKNCSDLVCSPNCFRVDDKVFYVYPDHKSNRLESYLKCEEQGMTMAMIKDQVTHQKVKDFFVMYVPDRYLNNRCYWIGLNRTSPSDPYQWTDGTQLSTLNVTRSAYAANEPCVSMCSGSWAYLFYNDYCYGYSEFDYFSFCEKRYPFLRI